MGINPERMRSLLQDLADEDPDAEARQQLIARAAPVDQARTRANMLLSGALLQDPAALMSAPPAWLVEMSTSSAAGAMLLFDSRLAELAARSVDELVAQGCTLDELIGWLEQSQPS